MSLSMAFIMSGVLTAVYQGFDDFIENWMLGFAIVWLIAFPAILIIAPRARRLAQQVTDEIRS